MRFTGKSHNKNKLLQTLCGTLKKTKKINVLNPVRHSPKKSEHTAGEPKKADVIVPLDDTWPQKLGIP
jgi:hypothetical protein